MSRHRTETDSLGPIEVPADAYYGAETARAAATFQVSGWRFPRRMLRALGLVKRAAAVANRDLGILEPRLAEAVVQAADEVIAGALDAHFVVDVFQTGSGTSTHMNANEVIANRANELLGGQRGSRTPVDPHDHVNASQSSNDVFPTALHVAALEGLKDDLEPALAALQASLESKAREFAAVVKCGRTHLQDAVPVTLGQELSGHASQVAHGLARLGPAREGLAELAIGGTAVGTGLNAPPEFAERVVGELGRLTGLELRLAANPFEALAARDACVAASGALKTVACSLSKIANDLRWLASGPRAGLGEIALPALQPGSSIMPGKVNPVVPECVRMVAAQVIGHDATIALAGLSGDFELNVMQPVIAHDLLESVRLLAGAARLLAAKCVDGLVADEARCRELVERSFALVTALTPRIGYDAAARIARESARTGKPVGQIAREWGVLPEAELERLLDPLRMTGHPQAAEQERKVR